MKAKDSLTPLHTFRKAMPGCCSLLSVQLEANLSLPRCINNVWNDFRMQKILASYKAIATPWLLHFLYSAPNGYFAGLYGVRGKHWWSFLSFLFSPCPVGTLEQSLSQDVRVWPFWLCGLVHSFNFCFSCCWHAWIAWVCATQEWVGDSKEACAWMNIMAWFFVVVFFFL